MCEVVRPTGQGESRNRSEGGPDRRMTFAIGEAQALTFGRSPLSLGVVGRLIPPRDVRRRLVEAVAFPDREPCPVGVVV
jgi:hypothetical protein